MYSERWASESDVTPVLVSNVPEVETTMTARAASGPDYVPPTPIIGLQQRGG